MNAESAIATFTEIAKVLPPGKVLVLHKMMLDNFDALRQAFRMYEIIVMVDDLEDISTLDEDDMRKYGWVKVKSELPALP